MRKLTNTSNVHPILAGWLAYDGYDYNPNTISVTTLIKPIKQTILGARVPYSATDSDVLDRVASQTGTAIHEHVEGVWVNHKDKILESLGYPQHVIDKIRVNPSKAELEEDIIPIFFEQRSERQVGGSLISGKYDVVFEGVVCDVKKTSTYTFSKGVKDEDYQLQGSIYKWLNPGVITEDHMNILFVFTDWMKSKAIISKDGSYPPYPAMGHVIPLLSDYETGVYVSNRVAEISKLWNADEAELPRCTDKDLWRDAPKHKYFAKPENVKATKNFDSLMEANAWCASKGKGIVKTVHGKVKACNYCKAFAACKQKEEYIRSGDLIVN